MDTASYLNYVLDFQIYFTGMKWKLAKDELVKRFGLKEVSVDIEMLNDKLTEKLSKNPMTLEEINSSMKYSIHKVHTSANEEEKTAKSDECCETSGSANPMKNSEKLEIESSEYDESRNNTKDFEPTSDQSDKKEICEYVNKQSEDILKTKIRSQKTSSETNSGKKDRKGSESDSLSGPESDSGSQRTLEGFDTKENKVKTDMKIDKKEATEDMSESDNRSNNEIYQSGSNNDAEDVDLSKTVTFQTDSSSQSDSQSGDETGQNDSVSSSVKELSNEDDTNDIVNSSQPQKKIKSENSQTNSSEKKSQLKKDSKSKRITVKKGRKSCLLSQNNTQSDSDSDTHSDSEGNIEYNLKMSNDKQTLNEKYRIKEEENQRKPEPDPSKTINIRKLNSLTETSLNGHCDKHDLTNSKEEKVKSVLLLGQSNLNVNVEDCKNKDISKISSVTCKTDTSGKTDSSESTNYRFKKEEFVVNGEGVFPELRPKFESKTHFDSLDTDSLQEGNNDNKILAAKSSQLIKAEPQTSHMPENVQFDSSSKGQQSKSGNQKYKLFRSSNRKVKLEGNSDTKDSQKCKADVITEKDTQILTKTSPVDSGSEDSRCNVNSDKRTQMESDSENNFNVDDAETSNESVISISTIANTVNTSENISRSSSDKSIMSLSDKIVVISNSDKSAAVSSNEMTADDGDNAEKDISRSNSDKSIMSISDKSVVISSSDKNAAVCSNKISEDGGDNAEKDRQQSDSRDNSDSDEENVEYKKKHGKHWHTLSADEIKNSMDTAGNELSDWNIEINPDYSSDVDSIPSSVPAASSRPTSPIDQSLVHCGEVSDNAESSSLDRLTNSDDSSERQKDVSALAAETGSNNNGTDHFLKSQTDSNKVGTKHLKSLLNSPVKCKAHKDASVSTDEQFPEPDVPELSVRKEKELKKVPAVLKIPVNLPTHSGAGGQTKVVDLVLSDISEMDNSHQKPTTTEVIYVSPDPNKKIVKYNTSNNSDMQTGTNKNTTVGQNNSKQPRFIPQYVFVKGTQQMIPIEAFKKGINPPLQTNPANQTMVNIPRVLPSAYRPIQPHQPALQGFNVVNNVLMDVPNVMQIGNISVQPIQPASQGCIENTIRNRLTTPSVYVQNSLKSRLNTPPAWTQGCMRNVVQESSVCAPTQPVKAARPPRKRAKKRKSENIVSSGDSDDFIEANSSDVDSDYDYDKLSTRVKAAAKNSRVRISVDLMINYNYHFCHL